MPRHCNELLAGTRPEHRRQVASQMCWFVIGLTSFLLALSSCAVDVREDNQDASGVQDAALQAPSTDAGSRFILEGQLPISTEQMDELITFVQQETGRDFLEPPRIATQSPREFEADIQQIFEGQGDRLRQEVRIAQALGLTEIGVDDAITAFNLFLSSPEGVQGYYDPVNGVLVVSNQTNDEALFRSVMSHELTHALDAQHANLEGAGRRIDIAARLGNFDPNVGLRSVVEGRANFVQAQWLDINGIELSVVDYPAGVVPAMILELSIPYFVGEEYIRELGGPSATWDQLRNPPLTSEEIFFPLSDGSRDTPVDVPFPRPDERGIPVQTPTEGEDSRVPFPPPSTLAPVFQQRVFGVADMYLWLLGDEYEHDQASTDQALQAIEGWAGGSAVVWGDGNETCIRFAVVVDSSTDRDELAEAAERWAGVHDHRTVVVTSDRTVTVTGCAPYRP